MQTMLIRQVSRSILAALALALALALSLTTAHAEPKALEGYGVLMMHGKGGRPGLFGSELVNALESRGAIVLEPYMPWSGERGVMRELNRTVPEMVAEIGRHVETLREKGATHIVLGGHSLGAGMALAYVAHVAHVAHAAHAAQAPQASGDAPVPSTEPAKPGGANDSISTPAPPPIAGLMLLAPGHTPDTWGRVSAMSLGVLQARALVDAGRGREMDSYLDINQGRQSWIRASAQAYLSLYDPEGPAVMPLNAARVPADLPVLVIIGDRDPLFRAGRRYLFDRLPAHAQSSYVEVKAGHVDTPDVGSEAAVKWLAGLRSASR